MRKNNYSGTDVEYEVEKEKKFIITRGMVILGVIILIAVILIIVMLSKSASRDEKEYYTTEDYKKLESRMIEEAPLYLSQNKIEVTDEYKIPLDKLLTKNGGTINLNVSDVCDGYVLVQKKESIEYTSYIKCNDLYMTEGYIKEDNNISTTTTTTQAKDNIKPDILIVGEKQITIYVGDKYIEPGYTATDNIDGDITANVVVTGSVDTSKIGAYTLTYTIKDSSGNENSTSRVVNVIKKNITTTYVGPKVTTTQKPVVKTTTRANVITKPIITLIGSETIIIYQGNKYKELGYSAKDALGNDITARVNIMNDININKAGSYIVKYTVTDNYGNTTTKIRSVIVKEKSIEVQYLTLTPDKISIKKNSQVQIIPNYNSNATAGTQITWKSSNTSVAVVNQNGLITAKNPGVVTITATSSNGKVAKAYITVTEK